MTPALVFSYNVTGIIWIVYGFCKHDDVLVLGGIIICAIAGATSQVVCEIKKLKEGR